MLREELGADPAPAIEGPQLRPHQVQMAGLAQRTQRRRLLGAAHRLGRLRGCGEHVQGTQQHPVEQVEHRRRRAFDVGLQRL